MESRKHIKLLCLCVAALMYTGCEQESRVDTGNRETESGYFSIDLAWGDALSTRAEEGGLQKEKEVNAVYMALFDKDDYSLRYLTDFGKAKNTAGTFDGDSVQSSASESDFTSKPIELKKGTYYLVALANPYPALRQKLEAGTITWSDLHDKEAAVGDFDSLAVTNGIFMSNAKGVLMLYPTEFRDSPEEAVASPKEVGLDRIVSKVMVNKSAGFQEPDQGKVTRFNWKLENCNSTTYLVRIPDRTSSGTEETLLSDRAETYAKDPNFDKGSQDKSGFYDMDEVMPWNEDPANSETNYSYVLENTLTPEVQQMDDWMDYTTHVIVEATIKYSGLGTDDSTYYSFNNQEGKAKIFTHAQAVEWWADGVADNQTFPSDMTGLKDSIAACQLFDFGASSTLPAGYSSEHGITFHKDGYNRYCIPVKHFNLNGADRTKYGQYGIVRNNVYKLMVNGIIGPGTPSLNQMYISVSINVNPWYTHDQEEPLE